MDMVTETDMDMVTETDMDTDMAMAKDVDIGHVSLSLSVLMSTSMRYGHERENSQTPSTFQRLCLLKKN
jgi:hypothetical protein